MRFDDSDDDELTDLMPRCSVQAMIQTANAHQSILEKHIKALLQLTEDINSAENQVSNSGSGSQHSSDSPTKLDTNSHSYRSKASDIIESTLPSLKFHLNLILESSNNATTALSQCLAVLTHQDDVSLASRAPVSVFSLCNTLVTIGFNAFPIPFHSIFNKNCSFTQFYNQNLFI